MVYNNVIPSWSVIVNVLCFLIFYAIPQPSFAPPPFSPSFRTAPLLKTRNPFLLSPGERRLSMFSQAEMNEAKSEAREMFYFGYDNYMSHAFPLDELDPIHCTGRGPDYSHPENININDVLGGYSLTLLDSLDSLVVFGDTEEFKRAVRLAIRTVSFDKNTTVQVFEANIRVIGSLLSAHLIASDRNRTLGDFYIDDYDGELLAMAHDLASRLMPAFDGSRTGIPYTRVNLQLGVLPETTNVTCTAGAGSLLLEFGILSRLLKDPTYEHAARRINEKIWQLRDSVTGLLGNLLNIQTGNWVGHVSGLGAGLDSFFEYLLKAYIMFGEKRDLQLFNEAYVAILENMRRGRPSCSLEDGEPPIFVNVDARDGSTANTWIDSLQASFAGVLLLAGDVDEAVCQHAIYYAIWKKYGVLPERFNWYLKSPDVSFYPLRPEFVESTYLLYIATKNPFYLHVGREIMDSLNSNTRVKCGFATVHDVKDYSLEDRMESFFLAETMKYLYLLFDENNPVNIQQERLLFSTEGHIFPIDRRFRNVEPDFLFKTPPTLKKSTVRKQLVNRQTSLTILSGEENDSNSLAVAKSIYSRNREFSNTSCETSRQFQAGAPPLDTNKMRVLFETIGLSPDLWD